MKDIKIHDISFKLLELLVVLVYLNPIADLLPSFAQMGIFIIWFLFNIKNSKLWGDALKYSILNIIIFVVTFIRCAYADQLNMDYYSTLQVVIARYQMMIYPILFAYVIRLSDKKKKQIFYLSLACIVGTIIVSLYYIIFVDPQAIRNTQRSVALFGVGDFMLMYSMAIIVGPLFFLITKMNKKKKNLFIFISFILILICLLLCNLVTSVVIAIVSVIVMYLVTRNFKYILIAFYSIIAFFVILKNWFAKLLYSLANQNIFYWSTNNKIVAIANVLSGDFTHVDTLTRRFMLASWSLESFKENMFFGINWKNHQYGTIGCHMQWADDLGRYGIFGNIFIIINYIILFISSEKRIKDTFVKKAMITVWIMFFILGFLNPCLSATNLMMIFVVIPCLEGVVSKKGEGVKCIEKRY